MTRSRRHTSRFRPLPWLLKERSALLDFGCVARVRLLDALRVVLELLGGRRLAAATGARTRAARAARAAGAARRTARAPQPAERALQLRDRLRVRRRRNRLLLAHLREVEGECDVAARRAAELRALVLRDREVDRDVQATERVVVLADVDVELRVLDHVLDLRDLLGRDLLHRATRSTAGLVDRL